MQSLGDHEQVLAISRIVDQIADEYLGDDPDWGPLHVVLPMEWCDGFMWMYRVEQDDAVIELYKHGITRRYLNLDQTNRAYRYTEDGYVPTPVALAVESVFKGIDGMGWSRKTVYDEEFIANKHRMLREAGWTVISTASLEPDMPVYSPGDTDVIREGLKQPP